MKRNLLILVIIMAINLSGCSNNIKAPTSSQISTQQQQELPKQQPAQSNTEPSSYDTSHFKVELTYTDDDRSQRSMNMAAGREVKRADDTLNEIYNKVLLKHKDDKNFIDKFTKAELAWIVFRDAQLESIYPAQDKQAYGSVYPMTYALEKATLTWDRVKQLNQWLEGYPEGTVGRGSR